MDAKLSKLFYHTIFYLTDDDKINYLRYQAIRYLNEELREMYYDQAVLVSKSLAGIIKTLMVKRLESSFHAFRISLDNLTKATGRMIEMFENDKVFIAPDLNVNDLMEKGISFEDIEQMILEMNIENPRNNIFKAQDFNPEFIDALKKDYKLLQELVKEWQQVKQDPKIDSFFEALKDELMNSNINLSGQLIIFTESSDTANYLQKEIEDKLNTNVLNISSDNRKRLFEIIQQNFDANYSGDLKDDYKILISTDVLAEGVNLHRANVIVNYDTPWNATRLMQRIGRVNRIGSAAGIVYNYNFYPSQQGDEEIRLYNNALVKLQGFHTAFGEDAQIFTHEELVEHFELFKEGMPDEEDKRLFYLRFIREFKDSNPKEFNRIKQFPLKARTARNNKCAVNESVKQASAVFLKSPYKMEFYQIDKDENVKSLTFLEAAEIFQANSSEPAYDLPKIHYTHVQAALDVFEKDFLGASTEKVTTSEKADAISAQAKKFLRDIKGLTKKSEVKTVCSNLAELIDAGTFTPLPNEIRKIRQQSDKKQISYAQVDNLLLLIGNKYDALELDDSESQLAQELDVSISPEIVTSETFIP